MFNTNYSMPTNLESIASKQSDVEKALSTLNAAIDAKKSMQEVATLEVSAKEAVKALNTSIAEQWVKEQQELPVAEAVKVYLDNAGEIAAFRLAKPSKDSVHYSITSSKKFLSYKKLEKAIKSASSSVWETMCARMLHNIALNLASEKEGISAKTLTSTMDKETAKKAGSVFDGSSNTKLEKQLNEVVVKAMLPKEFPVPQMKLADVRFLKGAVSNFKTGKEAGIEIQNENRFIAAVIASIYVRMNGLAYNMTSKAKIHKAEAK